MSCSLYWRQLATGVQVGDHQLRDAITAEFGSNARLERDALPFLRGLAAARVDGARALIAAIQRHGVIEIYLEC